ncbi:MAG: phage portal protein [Oscillospiraceae bacterium]|nr:phage portal protein [Oscillospiraceae bacterium]
MGLFERLFGKRQEAARNGGETFRLLSGYTPVFSNWRGSIYESELIRAALDAHGRHAAKLEPVLVGSARPELRTRLEKQPNDWQTWPQFLYQAATILYARNTCFIVPVMGEYGETVGISTICPDSWELVEYKGTVYIRFRFVQAKTKAIELDRVGILTRYQYKNEFFGENNDALKATLDLIAIQNKSVEESAKNSATYRFMATLSNFAKDEDISKERSRFDRENFQNGGGGVLIFPNTYRDVKQINAQQYALNAAQAKLIKENVYDYFGVNEEIIQNRAYGDGWSAFYEGAVEWLAINLSETITRMLFSQRERAFGARIFFSSNRMQYMSNADKLAVAAQMADRGLMTRNEIRAIFNLPPLEGTIGDSLPARGEYYNVNEKEANGDADQD